MSGHGSSGPSLGKLVVVAGILLVVVAMTRGTTPEQAKAKGLGLLRGAPVTLAGMLGSIGQFKLPSLTGGLPSGKPKAKQPRPAGKGDAGRCAKAAFDQGFRDDGLVTITAIGMAESRCNFTARCHNCIKGYTEDSRCAFQINLNAHPQYRRVDLTKPANCARAAWEVSGHGATFQPWSTFKHGRHRQYLAVARAAVRGRR